MRLTEKEFELVYARWRDTPLEGVKPDGQMFHMIKEAEDAKGIEGAILLESKPDRRAELLELAGKLAVIEVEESGMPSFTAVTPRAALVLDYAKAIIGAVDEDLAPRLEGNTEVVTFPAQLARDLLAWFAKLDDWSGVGDPPNLDDLKAALA